MHSQYTQRLFTLISHSQCVLCSHWDWFSGQFIVVRDTDYITCALYILNYFRSTSVFSAVEVFYENALYKFTFDIDIQL